MNISVVCAVMNRECRIVPCVRSWLDCNFVDQLVVVDWSSEESVADTLSRERFNHSKLKIIRVDDEQYFSLAKAYNIAIDASDHDTIIKTDVDHILIDDEMLLDDINNTDMSKEFLHGGGAGAAYLGFCCFDKTHNIRYNESFEGYGYDDLDMYTRLTNIGVHKRCFTNIKKCVYHVPHGDDLRVANYKVKNKGDTTETNKQISNNEPR